MKQSIETALNIVMDVISKGKSPLLVTSMSGNRPVVMSCNVQKLGKSKYIKFFDNKDKMCGNFRDNGNYAVFNKERTKCCERNDITTTPAFEIVFYNGNDVAQFKLLWIA